ncbi:hypothetical protein AURDEDRAFT_71822 [Auricularia subglabra TFB-10046 SS5]|nr:hypothetical protein AURDEDRAFT_71822 [Auricularia subglabra TFB-10046 SS5]
MEDYVHVASTSRSLTFWDIWHTGFFRNFEWGSPSAGVGFDAAEGGPLRLLFSLAIDWFTAHGGKQAGKKWSIGAIYLVCHNLPLEIRFLPENVCLVGIIPGRTKPLGHAINWFLQILVNELVSFYERGVWYTQTAKCPTGRLVWAALGPVVCDLDAARGIAGFGSVGHRLFCTICDITSSAIADFQTAFGPRGGPASERFPLWTRFVDLWNKATTIKEQEKLWSDYGMRWTELSRLSYWDPFRYLVIDPMHNLFLGLLKRHLRVIWGMDVDMTGWDLEERERVAAAAAGEDEEDVDPSVRPPTGKRKSKVVLGRGILSAASKDIRRTVLPDWLDPAPANVGNSKHGKLSANNWRVFCTIHCIITLIRLWGSSARDTRPFRVLENYLYLVKAVELATMRSTMKTRWETYTKHIVHYLEDLKEVYPKIKYTPNHHLATHLGEFLKRFGPPHSWWAFPFERYNGMLQKINTNDIIGKM